MNVGKFKRLAQLLVTSILLILMISPIVLSPSSVLAISTDENQLFMPLIFQNWPATPTTVTINPIDNSDQDNLFTVSWTPGESIDSYILEESANSDFSNSVQVYQGNSLSWLTPTGKFPGSFYYRAKGINQDRSGNWSISQFVTVFPLFVGLNIRMDAKGYIRGSEYYDIGVHATYQFNTLTDVDTIREDGHRWYDPNPLNFDPETWLSYFSPTTGQWKTSNIPPDPSWKWNGEYFMLAYGAQYTNGATVLFDGQKFTVSGPLDGYLTNGKPIKY